MTQPTTRALDTPVRIALDPQNPIGRAKIEVDGHDVSDHVNRYTLSHETGRIPTLVLEGFKLDVVFDGIAEVAIVAPEVAIGDAAATFIEALDPEIIQRMSLDAQQWLGGSQTQAALKVLASLARGGDGKFAPERG